MSELHEFTNNEMLIAQLSQRIKQVLDTEIAENGQALLAVSGGSSPKALFARLKDETIAWDKVTIILVDERWVDIEHPDSNEALVRSHLLQGGAAAADLVGWSTPAVSLEAAADSANQTFQTLNLPISVAILGMGTDGHTASWFADTAEYKQLLDPSCPPAVCATEPHHAPHPRLTLNYSAVVNSKTLFLQINGAEKRAVLDKALSATESKDSLPIRCLLGDRSALQIYWAAS